MIAVIDTSSLLALEKYYLSLEKNGKLRALLQEKFELGELIILDKVAEESKYVKAGIIFTAMPFLNDKLRHISTTSLLPPKAFFNMLENQFCNQDIRKLKAISDTEFENAKKSYLNSADGAIILYGHLNKNANVVVVTEESNSSNDNKLFKKIPECCRSATIICCSLPEYFQQHLNVNIADLLS